MAGDVINAPAAARKEGQARRVVAFRLRIRNRNMQAVQARGAIERGVYLPLAHTHDRRFLGRFWTMTFDDVYRRHLATVLRAASRAVGRRDVAEEITADAFLELYRQFDRIDAERLPGWLITVVRNRAIDYWRRQQLERRLVEQAGEATPDQTALEVASGNGLLRHPSLKPVHRACLSMRYEHGMTREEIAARLGLSETQVRGHLQYGLTLLRKHMSRNA